MKQFNFFSILKSNILLLFLILVLNNFSVFSQTDSQICATIQSNNPDPQGMYSYSTNLDALVDCDPIVINVYFWGINKPDGTNHFPNRKNDALQAIANANIAINPYGIFLKFRGYQEIDSPALPNDSNGYYVLENSNQYYNGLIPWVTGAGYVDSNAINIYAYGWGNGFGGAASGIGSTKSGLSSAGLLRPTFLHELGHNFGLYHTRSTGPQRENVTRDPNDVDCYNAHERGDRVVDTAANMGFSQGLTFPFVNLTTCEYIFNATELDTCLVTYNGSIDNQDIINVMGDAYDCMENYVTPGQGVRMRETLHGLSTTTFAAVLDDIEVLYEPYEGEYYFSGPIDPTMQKPLFQPGFTYRFVECDCNPDPCNEPSDYDDISFSYGTTSLLTVSKYETDFNIITHPNHSAIQIDLGPICDSYGQNIRRCYDNNNRAPIGGSVTKFNDGVLNANVTITPQDSTSINNPNLINALQPGLYKVEKIYEDGAVQENLIVKDNN